MEILKKQMNTHDLDAVVLTKNRRGALMFKRLVDTTGGTAIVVPRDGPATLFVYPVDLYSSREEAWVQVSELSREKADAQITEYVNQYTRDGGKVGALVSSLTHGSHAYYQNHVKGELVEIGDTIVPEVYYGLLPGEVAYQRKVSELADIAVSAAREAMAPGVTEYEIAAEASYAMRRNGAEATSFDTIVSTGHRSAYSHGWPTQRRLKQGEFMLIDLGPMADGYAADETRTYLLGSDPKKERMLEAMDEAVAAVIREVKPGASCRELDAISRRVLKEHGFPDYPHTLGHPISGFTVPELGKTSTDVLREGMLFTVEPGIYLPGYGGVRLEENVVVTKDGCEQLTRSPRIP